MLHDGAAATEEQPGVQFQDLFSLRKPRDARAGFASGLKSIAKGVLAGTVGLVAAPIIGAHQEGFRGLAKGAAAGVAGAVVLPVTGCVVGTAQIVRGMVNTPEAMRQSMLGRYWDEDTRTWIDNPGLALALDDDDAAAASARRAWARHGRHAGRAGAGQQAPEEDFYQLLGVPRDAPPDLIKKQYYILARRLHPDKCPGDPQAKERFQKLGEAYQVLCNPELRRRYDAHGSEGLDVNFMDSGEFFNALFGSDKFDHLVGELIIAAAARSGGDLTPAQLKRLQLAREEKLVVMLGALLRRWVEGDCQGFRDSMSAEAAELAAASFGEVMLHTVGRVYQAQADIFLGGLFEGSLAAIRAKGHSLRSQVNAASLALKVYQTQQQMERLDRQEQAQQAARAQQQAAADSGAAASTQPDISGAAAAAEGSGEPSSRQEPATGESGNDGTDSSSGSSGGGIPAQEQKSMPAPQQPAGPASGAAAPDSAAAAAAAAAAASERAKLEEQALPIMLDAMWAANVLDIQSTLRHVCRRVLNDPQVPKPVRQQRAEGLRELGRIFRAARAPGTQTDAGASAGGGKAGAAAQQAGQQAQRSAKQQMEDAMLRVLEKRMQQADSAA